MLAATKVKMSGSEKKREDGYIQQFLHKTFNSEVSRCLRAKQRQRNVQESVLHVQSCFSLIRATVFFFGCFGCRRRLALHDYILPRAKSIYYK